MPYLATSVMIAVLASPGAVFGQQTGDLEQLRQRALELVNQARQEQGLEKLTLGPALNEAAQKHAEDMLEQNYYAHVSPDGDSVADRFQEAGGSRWRLTAENIARCQGCPSPPTTERVENLQEGWMNSPEHRENILRRGLDRFGFGIVVGDDRTLYAVQTFSGAGTSRNAQPGEDASDIDHQRQNELAAQRINKARGNANAGAVEPDLALMQAASNLLPEQSLSSAGAAPLGNLMEALPDGERTQWSSVAALMGSCGGCGTQPNAADVRSFIQQWLDDPQYRERLLNGEFTNFGFIVRANGDGLKSAVLILGQQR